MGPQPIDRAALTRQFLAAAAGRAVDQVLPGVTACNAALPKHANRQNEPTAVADGRPTPYVTAKQRAAQTSPAVNAVLPGVTRCDVALPNSAIGKTNPPGAAAVPRTAPGVRATGLSAQQLAAARLLACGRFPIEVAAELGIHRQTLWRWRRMPEFEAEVFRLHECLVWTAGATSGRGPGSGRRGMS